MNIFNNKEYQRGQALLIVVLIMVTLLTVGLSFATRTITNVRVSEEEENSEQAFSAAEAGIEQSLTTNLQTSGNFTNGTTYTTSVLRLAGIEMLLNNGAPILKDSGIDVLLTDYPNYSTPRNGNVTIYWGSSSDVCSRNEFTNTQAALEIVVISGSRLSPVSRRYAVDPCAARASVNRFESIPAGGRTINGQTFAYKKTISVTSGLIIRVVPIYAATSVGITGCDGVGANCVALAEQGSIIQSVGVSNDTQRKIINFTGYPTLPTEIFPFVLFSPR